VTLPDLDLPDRQHAITEYVQAPIDYIKQEDIARLGGRAKPLAAANARMIAAIEQQSGVLLAIWLREADLVARGLSKTIAI
jgi:sulfur transfer complex TusBCD TusB component (DsrH family)